MSAAPSAADGERRRYVDEPARDQALYGREEGEKWLRW